MRTDRNNIQLSANINLQELQCPCCERVMVSAKGVKLLQEVADETGLPLIFHSGYRCPPHNKKVGGVKHSYHPKGSAWDIRLLDEEKQIKAIKKRFPFYYVNRRKGFIHMQTMAWGNE